MQIKKMAALASLTGLFLSAPAAHAELQTWRLTSTADQVQNGFIPPSFIQVGNVFTIDYLIDTEITSAPGWDGLFDAVQSFTINGITSQAGGNVNAMGSWNAINISPISSRVDGIDFLSFNNFDGHLAMDVGTALNDFSAATPTSVDLRVDFGIYSVWAKPSSFALMAVPEPSSGWLLLAALPLALLRKHKPHRA